jgi:hypothetical protein
MAGRALSMLAAASEMPLEDLARMSVGQRDAHLLDLRDRIFGQRIEAVTACPECGEDLELSFDSDQVRSADQAGNGPDRTYVLEDGGYTVRFRPPDSSDLQAIAGCESPAAARDLLLERCIHETRGTAKRGNRKGQRSGPPPPRVIEKLVEIMARIDPQANVRLSLTCPSCRHGWSAIFDIASFIWSEINDQAKRLLREVHVIASAYGWSEAEIVGMSAERRSIYLEMLGET